MNGVSEQEWCLFNYLVGLARTLGVDPDRLINSATDFKSNKEYTEVMHISMEIYKP